MGSLTKEIRAIVQEAKVYCESSSGQFQGSEKLLSEMHSKVHSLWCQVRKGVKGGYLIQRYIQLFAPPMGLTWLRICVFLYVRLKMLLHLLCRRYCLAHNSIPIPIEEQEKRRSNSSRTHHDIWTPTIVGMQASSFSRNVSKHDVRTFPLITWIKRVTIFNWNCNGVYFMLVDIAHFACNSVAVNYSEIFVYTDLLWCRLM